MRKAAVSEQTYARLSSLKHGDMAAIKEEYLMPTKDAHNCYECASPFGFTRWRHHCQSCGQVFCSACTNNTLQGREGRTLRVCSNCYHVFQTMPIASTADEDNRSGAASPVRAPSVHPHPHPHVGERGRSLSLRHLGELRPDTPPQIAVRIAEAATTSTGEELISRTYKPVALNLPATPPIVAAEPQKTFEILSGELGLDDDDLSHLRESFAAGKGYAESISDEEQPPRIGAPPLTTSGSGHHLVPPGPLTHHQSSSDLTRPSAIPAQITRILETEQATASSPLTRKASSEVLNDSFRLRTPATPAATSEVAKSPLGSPEEVDSVGPEKSAVQSPLNTSMTFSSPTMSVLPASAKSWEEVLAAPQQDSNAGGDNFKAASEYCLKAMVHQNLMDARVENIEEWEAMICTMVTRAAERVSPSPRDASRLINDYVTVLHVSGGTVADTEYVHGAVCCKNVAHRKMRTHFERARILLLSCPLEYDRVRGKISTFDSLLSQEKEFLQIQVAKITSVKPDIVIVEQGVSRLAQDALFRAGVTLVLNVEADVLRRVERLTGAEIWPSIDNLQEEALGVCSLFRTKTIVDAAGAKRPHMYFDGCPDRLGATIVLRGVSEDNGADVQKCTEFALFMAYNLRLERAFLTDIRAEPPEQPSASTPTFAGASGFQHISVSRRLLSSSMGIVFPPPFMDGRTGKTPAATPVQSPASKVGRSMTSSAATGPPSAASPMRMGIARAALLRNLPEQLAPQTNAGPDFSASLPKTPDPVNAVSMSPHDHQSLLVVFCTRNTVRGDQCIKPQLQPIAYYDCVTDLSVGGYVETCCNPELICSRDDCRQDMYSHVCSYVHHTGCVNVTVQQLPSGHVARDEIVTWSVCNVCKASTPVNALSEDAKLFSFGKFLELILYGETVKSRPRVCDHSLYQEHTRHFALGEKVVVFQYESISIYKLVAPPPVLITNPEIGISLRALTLEWLRDVADKIYDAVGASLDMAQKELARSPGFDTQRLTQMLGNFKLERKRFSDQLVELGPVLHSMSGLNKLRRTLYCNTLNWNTHLQALAPLFGGSFSLPMNAPTSESDDEESMAESAPVSVPSSAVVTKARIPVSPTGLHATPSRVPYAVPVYDEAFRRNAETLARSSSLSRKNKPAVGDLDASGTHHEKPDADEPKSNGGGKDGARRSHSSLSSSDGDPSNNSRSDGLNFSGILPDPQPSDRIPTGKPSALFPSSGAASSSSIFSLPATPSPVGGSDPSSPASAFRALPSSPPKHGSRTASTSQRHATGGSRPGSKVRAFPIDKYRNEASDSLDASRTSQTGKEKDALPMGPPEAAKERVRTSSTEHPVDGEASTTTVRSGHSGTASPTRNATSSPLRNANPSPRNNTTSPARSSSVASPNEADVRVSPSQAAEGGLALPPEAKGRSRACSDSRPVPPALKRGDSDGSAAGGRPGDDSARESQIGAGFARFRVPHALTVIAERGTGDVSQQRRRSGSDPPTARGAPPERSAAPGGALGQRTSSDNSVRTEGDSPRTPLRAMPPLPPEEEVEEVGPDGMLTPGFKRKRLDSVWSRPAPAVKSALSMSIPNDNGIKREPPKPSQLPAKDIFDEESEQEVSGTTSASETSDRSEDGVTSPARRRRKRTSGGSKRDTTDSISGTLSSTLEATIPAEEGRATHLGHGEVADGAMDASRKEFFSTTVLPAKPAPMPLKNLDIPSKPLQKRLWNVANSPNPSRLRAWTTGGKDAKRPLFKGEGDLGVPDRDALASVLASPDSLRSTARNGLASGEVPLSSLLQLAQPLNSAGRAHMFLPPGVDGTVLNVIEDEPSSVIAYHLASEDYRAQLFGVTETNPRDRMSADACERMLLSARPSDKAHFKHQFEDAGTKFYVKSYYAASFHALRQQYCRGDVSFVESLTRCRKWAATGGKSKSSFCKTHDERLVLKEISRTELVAFLKFGPAYFEYLAKTMFKEELPSLLVKSLGLFRVSVEGPTASYVQDLLVMENVLYNRTGITRVFDLKGSERSRYVKAATDDHVLMDENFLEFLSHSPSYIREHDKKVLCQAVWNDSLFLSELNVMDYSLLVGYDDEGKELVVGIIDYLRQYTWDKQLEKWVKSTGILGGGGKAPTVIAPVDYKLRFRAAMTRYFIMAPDKYAGLEDNTS